jgi:hypothetical protein
VEKLRNLGLDNKTLDNYIMIDPRGRKWRETGEDFVKKSFITCTPQQILLG